MCVSYDGFDGTEETVFPDTVTETAKIEEYVQENFGGRIHVAYGCSMGGSFVGLLIQRKRFTLITAFWAALIWTGKAVCLPD